MKSLRKISMMLVACTVAATTIFMSSCQKEKLPIRNNEKPEKETRKTFDDYDSKVGEYKVENNTLIFASVSDYLSTFKYVSTAAQEDLDDLVFNMKKRGFKSVITYYNEALDQFKAKLHLRMLKPNMEIRLS